MHIVRIATAGYELGGVVVGNVLMTTPEAQGEGATARRDKAAVRDKRATRTMRSEDAATARQFRSRQATTRAGATSWTWWTSPATRATRHRSATIPHRPLQRTQPQRQPRFEVLYEASLYAVRRTHRIGVTIEYGVAEPCVAGRAPPTTAASTTTSRGRSDLQVAPGGFHNQVNIQRTAHDNATGNDAKASTQFGIHSDATPINDNDHMGH